MQRKGCPVNLISILNAILKLTLPRLRTTQEILKINKRVRNLLPVISVKVKINFGMNNKKMMNLEKPRNL